MEAERRERRPVPEPRARELRMPSKMNWLTFARAVPGIFTEWDGLKHVPEEFVSADADDDGRPLAVIACPCGETPSVGLALSTTCNCRRVFIGVGHGEVRAFRPPPMTDEEYV